MDEIQSGPIRRAWRQFWIAILDPWNVLLLLAVIALLTTSALLDQAQVVVILQVLASIAAAILGGRITKYLDELAEGSVLEARGKVAVRGLKLLYRNIGSLEERVSAFLARDDHIRGNADVTVRNYEEVVVACRLMQEEAISAIENWTDIVAEANIQSLIGEISSLKATVDQMQGERDSLSSRLEVATRDGEESAQELRRKLEAKENELEAVRLRLASANSQVVFSNTERTKASSGLAQLFANSHSLSATSANAELVRRLRESFAKNPADASGGDTPD